MVCRILILIYLFFLNFCYSNCSEFFIVTKTYSLVRILVKYALQKLHCRGFFEALVMKLIMEVGLALLSSLESCLLASADGLNFYVLKAGSCF